MDHAITLAKRWLVHRFLDSLTLFPFPNLLFRPPQLLQSSGELPVIIYEVKLIFILEPNDIDMDGIKVVSTPGPMAPIFQYGFVKFIRQKPGSTARTRRTHVHEVGGENMLGIREPKSSHAFKNGVLKAPCSQQLGQETVVSHLSFGRCYLCNPELIHKDLMDCVADVLSLTLRQVSIIVEHSNGTEHPSTLSKDIVPIDH